MQKPYFFRLLSLLFLILLMISCLERVSIADETPLKQKWAPSEFGLTDQLGSVNWITSSKVLTGDQWEIAAVCDCYGISLLVDVQLQGGRVVIIVFR